MSNIEWTEATWNPVIGCTPVSPGCLNCYAATMARRLEGMGKPEYAPKRIAPDGTERIGHIAEALEPGTKTVRIAEVRNGRAVFTGEVRTLPDRLDVPLNRRKPTMYFVNSMSDLFHEDVPVSFIKDVFRVMRECPQHTFQILTKRPDRMAAEAPLQALPNVWLGTSVENQEQADKRIPHLLRCPAAVRFLSCEPLLGAIRLPLDHGTNCDEAACEQHRRRLISWVIAGGESGPGARPCDVAWIRSIVGQCRDAGVPVFVKQLGRRPVIPANEPWTCLDRKGGDPAEWPEHLRVREMPR